MSILCESAGEASSVIGAHRLATFAALCRMRTVAGSGGAWLGKSRVVWLRRGRAAG
jgi:hypothetical protein